MSTIKITDIDEVRAGDRVTVETVANDGQAGGDVVTATVVEYDGALYVLGWCLAGPEVRFIFAEREVPDVPTEPGHYIDKDGNVWRLDECGEWWTSGHGDPSYVYLVERYAPLTRLIPETELTAQREKIVAFLRDRQSMMPTIPILIDRLERGEF